MRLHSFTVKVYAVAMAMGSLTSCHTKEASKDIIQDNVDKSVLKSNFWHHYRHFLRIFHRFSIILDYLCRRFAALGNLKASFHCAHLQHLFRQIKEIKTTLR